MYLVSFLVVTWPSFVYFVQEEGTESHNINIYKHRASDCENVIMLKSEWLNVFH